MRAPARTRPRWRGPASPWHGASARSWRTRRGRPLFEEANASGPPGTGFPGRCPLVRGNTGQHRARSGRVVADRSGRAQRPKVDAAAPPLSSPQQRSTRFAVRDSALHRDAAPGRGRVGVSRRVRRALQPRRRGRWGRARTRGAIGSRSSSARAVSARSWAVPITTAVRSSPTIPTLLSASPHPGQAEDPWLGCHLLEGKGTPSRARGPRGFTVQAAGAPGGRSRLTPSAPPGAGPARTSGTRVEAPGAGGGVHSIGERCLVRTPRPPPSTAGQVGPHRAQHRWGVPVLRAAAGLVRGFGAPSSTAGAPGAHPRFLTRVRAVPRRWRTLFVRALAACRPAFVPPWKRACGGPHHPLAARRGLRAVPGAGTAAGRAGDSWRRPPGGLTCPEGAASSRRSAAARTAGAARGRGRGGRAPPPPGRRTRL